MHDEPRPDPDHVATPSMALAMDGPVLIFGGCYSNLEATLALRNEAGRRSIPASHIVCTGDVVAYCADAAATTDLIRDWGVHVVRGNCEESLGWNEATCGCGFAEGTACERLSVEWYAYASNQLTDDQRAWMRSLPARIDMTVGKRRLAVVHGSLDQINRFVFPSTPWQEKARELARSCCDGIVGGHSGIPFADMRDGHLWLNTGALGMPANDGTARVWYCVLTPGASYVEIRLLSLEYDARAAAKKMRVHGLPQAYASALETGFWPSCDILPPPERASRGVAICPASLCWPDNPSTSRYRARER